MQADFVIITALEEERDAVLRHLPSPTRLPAVDDGVRIGYLSEVAGYRVVLVTLLGMGRVEAASATDEAIRRWSPKAVMLVGICGGVGSRGVALGDVVVSDQVVDYELQKVRPESVDIRWRAHLCAADLVAVAKDIRSDDWLPRVQVARPIDGTPRRLCGPVATGDKVAAADAFMNQYTNVWPALLGIEMEAGGVAHSCFASPKRPKFLMIRGVSDLANEKKDASDTQSWRAYACDVAAAYAAAFLSHGPFVRPAVEAGPIQVALVPGYTTEFADLRHALERSESWNHAQITEEGPYRIETWVERTFADLSTRAVIFVDLSYEWHGHPRPEVLVDFIKLTREKGRRLAVKPMFVLYPANNELEQAVRGLSERDRVALSHYFRLEPNDDSKAMADACAKLFERIQADWKREPKSSPSPL